MGKSCAHRPEGSRFESGWATIDLFPQCFSSSYKNSMSTCKSSSQVPHQSFRVQTAALLIWPSAPPAVVQRVKHCIGTKN